MRNIFYSASAFHKAVKRNTPERVFLSFDFWFYTQKAILIYRPVDENDKYVMFDWLIDQGVKIDER